MVTLKVFELVLPEDDGPEQAVPLVVAFHGGGGNRHAQVRSTCPTDDLDDPECLHNYAADHGFALLMPNGAGSPLVPSVRTWNAGGGDGTWECASGRACQQGVDDIAYVDALLDHVLERAHIDPSRIYATGLSNGGAMSHRLGCQMADRFAAIAPIAGGNQYATSAECEPSRAMPVMHIHGTDDPVWQYDSGDSPSGHRLVSAERTMTTWSEVNGCSGAPEETALEDTEDDGTRTFRYTHRNCDAPTVHLKIRGGGHTWPNGLQYFSERRIGPVPRDWGNERIWGFLKQHALPDDVGR